MPNNNTIQEFCCIETPIGILQITGNKLGISSINPVENGVVTTNIPLHLQEAVTQIQDYFVGKRKEFNFTIQPSGTAFQRSVWEELRNIPYGKTISYLDLAKKLGDPKVIRAAATANGKNPMLIAIPCHRVIGSDGSLTGYSGGLWRKKWLLEHENPTNQQSLF